MGGQPPATDAARRGRRDDGKHAPAALRRGRRADGKHAPAAVRLGRRNEGKRPPAAVRRGGRADGRHPPAAVRDARRVGGRPGTSRAARSRGQATVELLGALPAILLTGLVVFQLLAVGYAKVLAGNAAEAAAIAVAGGGEARGAARAAVPGWSRARMRVESRAGRVVIRMRPPSPLRAVGRALEVEATAAVNR